MRFPATPFLFAVASANTGYAFKDDAVRRGEIERLNLLPGMTWKAGFNERFAGAPPNASKELCGIFSPSIAFIFFNHESYFSYVGVKSGNLERIQEGIRSGAIKVVNASMLGATNIPIDFDSEINWPECSEVRYGSG